MPRAVSSAIFREHRLGGSCWLSQYVSQYLGRDAHSKRTLRRPGDALPQLPGQKDKSDDDAQRGKNEIVCTRRDLAKAGVAHKDYKAILSTASSTSTQSP